MKNILKRVFTLLLFPAICLSIQGCNNNNIVQNQNENPVSRASSTESNRYSYASRLNLDESTLENLLKTSQNGKEYKLIPAANSSKDLDYWTNLVTTDKEYMQTFFLNRDLLDNRRATSQYDEIFESMWVETKPNTLLFIATLDGKYCGIIGCDEIKDSSSPIVFYATSKEYKNQGIATNSVKMLINLLKHLNETKFYDIKSISVWIFDDNIASITVAKNNGFVYTENDEVNKRSRYSLTLKTESENK